MFQKFAIAFKAKTSELFADEDDHDPSDSEGFALLDSAEDFITDLKVVVIKPDRPHDLPPKSPSLVPKSSVAETQVTEFEPSCDLSSKSTVTSRLMNMQLANTLISSIFATVSSFEASYLQLQTAHVPFVEENIKAADRALVSHLQRLSDFKLFYKDVCKNPDFIGAEEDLAIGSCLEHRVQENQSKLRTLEIVSNRLQEEIDEKDNQVTALRKQLGEIRKCSSNLSKKLSNSLNSSVDVRLTVRVFATMLHDACRTTHKFTKILIDLMKKSGWDLDLAANSVYPDVNYVKKGHIQYAFLSYVCLGMFQGFDLDGLPRTHKDSAAVADVWPSNSAFDGYLSALSPLQLVRSNSRRFMPSQTDEEAHQLSYLQKHMANILQLLAEPAEGAGEESLVLSMEGLEHLAFLIQFGEKGSEGIPLSQAAPFFANSDPDMPAVPVPAAPVHDWLLQNIASALEHLTERVSPREKGPANNSDQDVVMADACSSSIKSSTSAKGLNFIEGISKSSYLKQASELKGSSVKVINCHDSSIYILAPLRYATVYGCSDATIILGAVGKAARVEHCERVHVITAAKQICIANCRECLFFLGVNQRPLIVGDNHKLQVAPYNTFYSRLEEHMAEVGIEATINRWDEPLALGAVDPHDSLSHSAGVSDVQAESATQVDPDQFIELLIPSWFGGESPGSTKANPFPLPDAYVAAQQRKQKNSVAIKKHIKEAQTPLDENRKREVSSALHVYFRDWLYATGNIRQLYCLHGD